MLNAFFRNLVRKLAFGGGWIVLAIIVWASVVPIHGRPDSGFGVNLEREMAFALLGSLFAVAIRSRPLMLLVLLVAFVAGLELLQELVPTRHGRLEDFFVKSAGTAVGLMLGVIAREWLGVGRPKP